VSETLASVDAVVLAGGLGTRIAGVLGSTPKVLAPIQGSTFLDLLMVRLSQAGIRHVVLALGHLGEAVTRHLETSVRHGMTIDCAIEPKPLGTAGALRFTLGRLRSDPVLVLNGDSVAEVDLPGAVSEHRQSGCEASLVCVEVDDARRYGRVVVAADGTVERFIEKDPAAAGRALINAGIYCFSRAALDRLAKTEGPSLERDFLEKLPRSALHAIVRRGAFIDIGTPESLAGAGDFFGGSSGGLERKDP